MRAVLQVYADVHVHPVCVVTRFLVVVVVVVVEETVRPVV